MAISMFGFFVYVVGIPALLSWKLVSNRHYAIFTKSISLQEVKLRQAAAQARQGKKAEPEEVVQTMLDLCQVRAPPSSPDLPQASTTCTPSTGRSQ